MFFNKVNNISKNNNIHFYKLKEIIIKNNENIIKNKDLGSKIKSINQNIFSLEDSTSIKHIKKNTLKKNLNENPNNYLNVSNINKKKSKILDYIELSDLKINDLDTISKSKNNESLIFSISNENDESNEKLIIINRIKTKIKNLKINKNSLNYKSNDIYDINKININKIEYTINEIEENRLDISMEKLKKIDTQIFF